MLQAMLLAQHTHSDGVCSADVSYKVPHDVLTALLSPEHIPVTHKHCNLRFGHLRTYLDVAHERQDAQTAMSAC